MCCCHFFFLSASKIEHSRDVIFADSLQIAGVYFLFSFYYVASSSYCCHFIGFLCRLVQFVVEVFPHILDLSVDIITY